MTMLQFLHCIDAIYRAAGFQFEEVKTESRSDNICMRYIYLRGKSEFRCISVSDDAKYIHLITYCPSLSKGGYFSRWFDKG